MGELLFVGLGLEGDRDLGPRSLEALRSCDAVFLDTYTSVLPGLDLVRLAASIRHAVQPVGRAEVEQGEAILEAAFRGRAALLVPGDPMTATTHADLRLRAHRRGIATRLFPGASILTAAAGLVGLHVYKFGPPVSLPRPQRSYRPSSPYEKLAENRGRDQHTLVLLDTGDGERPLTANEGLDFLLELEGEFRRGVCARESLACVVGRAGSDSATCASGSVGDLIEGDCGPPPHVLLFPATLHFSEEEALRAFAPPPKPRTSGK